MPSNGEEESCNGVSKIDSIMASCRFPITLQFIDICYRVKLDTRAGGCGARLRRMLHPRAAAGGDSLKPPEERRILNGVTGVVSPGEMLAILGPSGSGKSTLLNVMAGRVGGKHTGSVLANGRRLTRSVQRRTGFVTQDDVLYPHLTVRETLVFCALLRLPAAVARAEKVAAADAVLAELGLSKCADTRVGNAYVRGVSGGERRRVSIGHEMLVNPSLLLLDEPTSGLDSTAAARLVAALGEVARKGRAVALSVHQPSSRVFQMFDTVMLLSEGSCLYFGPARDAMDYFGSVGFTPRFHVNPADLMLDLANGVAPIEYQGNAERFNIKQSLISAYNSDLAPRVKACVSAAANAPSLNSTGAQTPVERDYNKDLSGASWPSQFSTLLRRSLKERRHESFQALRVTQVIAAALLAGSMWWRSDVRDVQDRLGLLFFVSIFWGVFASFNSVFTFPQDRPILARERASGMYTLSSYFLARTAGDLPMELVLPSAFALVCYWMAGLRPEPGPFLLTVAVLLGYVLVAQGLGLFLGAAIMDAKQASTVATVTMLAFLLTAGFYVQRVPVGLVWMKYTSFTFYCYRLLITVQYRGTHHHYQNTNSIVRKELEEEVGAGVSVAVMVLMLLGYRALAYCALRRIKA